MAGERGPARRELLIVQPEKGSAGETMEARGGRTGLALSAAVVVAVGG